MIQLNGFDVKPTVFPDGTSQVWKLDRDAFRPFVNTILWKFDGEAEFMHLAQLVDLVRIRSIGRLDLIIPFLPYARQDKDISNEATFALKTFTRLLNSLSIDMIVCVDPHSGASFEIENLHVTYPKAEVSEAIEQTRSDLVCYPDRGAFEKYWHEYRFPYMHAEKTRDQLSGHITGNELFGDPKDKRILIVDDICDGGMTFILLTKKLLEAGAVSVSLFVSHGIFSKGIQVLKDSGIERIFTHEGEVK